MPDADDPPTEDELPSLARDVTYEFRMAHLAATKLRRLGSPTIEDLEWSAWVEVLLLHSRVLADFFGSAGSRDDLSAIHYSPNWDPESDDVTWLREHIPAINKRVMHLTAYRHRERDRVDAPEVDELILRLARVFAAFVDGLSPERRSWFPIQFR
jgi:hypothetical protein